jgi:hypothetical protein
MKTKTGPQYLNRLATTFIAVVAISTICNAQAGEQELKRLDKLAMKTASGAVYAAPRIADEPEAMAQAGNDPVVAAEFNQTEPVYLVENSERRTVCNRVQVQCKKSEIHLVKVACIKNSRAAAWRSRGKYLVTPYVVEYNRDFIEM